MDTRGSAAVDWLAWPAPPPHHTIGPNDVDVWCASLNDLEAVPGTGEWLSVDERERAERFRFDRDRQRSVLHRGILRALLGRYLALDPRDIAFASGPSGKP